MELNLISYYGNEPRAWHSRQYFNQLISKIHNMEKIERSRTKIFRNHKVGKYSKPSKLGKLDRLAKPLVYLVYPVYCFFKPQHVL